jgi:hypothetical protein
VQELLVCNEDGSGEVTEWVDESAGEGEGV